METKFTPAVNLKIFSVLFSSTQQYVLSSVIFVLIGLINFNLLAQTEAQRLQIKSKTNVAALQQMAIDFGNYATQRKMIADQWAIANGLPLSGETPDGSVFLLIDYDSISGPQYIVTNNINSAQTISTDKVLVGGTSGLNLSGSGITLSMWDGGFPCPQHPEYINRVTLGIHEATATPTPHFHATHVAGTLIASGIDPSARGMAPSANLNYYDIGSFQSEIPLEAADGTLLSNHSWGSYNQGWALAGGVWRWSSNPAYTEYEKFGLYTFWTQMLDKIANNAPYHLMVRSAENDRGYGPPTGTIHGHYYSGPIVFTDFHEKHGGSGGFDCMGQFGCAKNVLTVGATWDIPNSYTSPSDVVLAGFSNTGPTDDGRIKPDVVANGISLYSSYNIPNFGCITLGYNSLWGTSMSAPSVTGSAALLQEHYSSTHGGFFMLASTLKALIIESASESGTNNGPDYHHGWGLMNTEKAAEIITKDQSATNIIQELTLVNGQTINIPFTIPNTSNCYLSATIVWNDPAGTPPPVSLDPTNLMLVNDLDLRIIDPLSGTNFPWTLDPLNPANAAIQTADNFRDNVEQVRIYNAIPGSYIVRITHKGVLANPQDFSIIINVVPSDDLYVRDSPEDVGNEPNVETAAVLGTNFWSSSDIWIRQTNDGLLNQVSEPIEYTSGIPNYIYVRVKNKGLCPQTADLRVYWAKASTGLSWPSQWENYNTTYPSCAASLYGNEITPSTNVTIPAQSEQIFEIQWQPNNPDDYNCFVDPFHFCLLGRIETTPVAPYGMTFPEGSSVWSNTVDNNNIAWKNVIINNNNPGKFEPFGTTIVRNVEEKANFINLNFASQKDDIGQYLIDFKRIQLYCSKDFIKRWAEGGKRGKDVILVNDSVVEILSANATMEHIFLRYNEIGAVSLALETKKDPTLSNDKYFNFDIIQYTEGDKIPQGGQTYQIKKGVSRKDCLTPAYEVSKIISGNQVYSDSVLISSNIIVPQGATLRFEKAIVMLAENVSIKVMPGGKLIIDASRLESSCIGKKWAGIEVKGAPAFQNPLTIKNSFIAGSDSPLSLDKTQGILISQSTFLGDNIGTAIVMNKMKDFQISENTFSNFITGIKTTNTSAADVKSIIEKNIFLNVKIALDFTQDKHTKLDVKCNRFSYTDYAILSDQTLLKDQGVIGEGAGNEFISNSTLANNKLKHTNGNSPKYYYDPSQPITSGMNVTTLLSATDRVCYVYSFDTSTTISSQRLSTLSTQEEVIPMEVISVYSVPNPNTGKSTIFYNLGGEKQGELVIMDIYGKIIRQIKVTSESNKIDVDYNGCATGVYLISLKNSKGEVTNHKMIIEK